MAVVKIICKNLKNNPHCPHGPTLRFVRVQDGKEQEFYACSTCRDRKDCGFYLAVGDKLTERLQEVCDLERKRLLPAVDHPALETRYKAVRAVSASERLYCQSCSQLDTVSNREEHRGHQFLTPVSDLMLAQPSSFLNPKEGSKKEAQYFFTESTTKVIVENLRRAEVRRVLCLGTPRVHEYIQTSARNLQSLLLDLDHRYHSFWPKDKFVWYNMFNRHTLGDTGAKKLLRGWLGGGGPHAVVMDPPFGGHVVPLSATLRHLTRLSQHEQLMVVWVFPYFREGHILTKFPSLQMMDYRVLYENHRQFKKGNSAVRLFTNIPARQFELPRSEGYRLCVICNKWVSKENKHCAKCGFCSTKAGLAYAHCDECNCCVKPRWQHCFACQRCLPTPHSCQNQTGLQNTNGTKEPRHKRIKTVLVTNTLRVKNKKFKRKK